jgi:hypothetical protein
MINSVIKRPPDEKRIDGFIKSTIELRDAGWWLMGADPHGNKWPKDHPWKQHEAYAARRIK